MRSCTVGADTHACRAALGVVWCFPPKESGVLLVQSPEASPSTPPPDGTRSSQRTADLAVGAPGSAQRAAFPRECVPAPGVARVGVMSVSPSAPTARGGVGGLPHTHCSNTHIYRCRCAVWRPASHAMHDRRIYLFSVMHLWFICKRAQHTPWLYMLHVPHRPRHSAIYERAQHSM